MHTRQASLIAQIDIALGRVRDLIQTSRHDDLSDHPREVLVEVQTLCTAAIERLAPAGSAYQEAAEAALDSQLFVGKVIRELAGIMTALRANYLAGYLQSVEGLIRGEVFDDFLEMAGHLLDSGYKDASAVIVGSVLEEHLRKLGSLYQVTIVDSQGAPKKADRINAELAKASAYGSLDQKSITSWLGLRNNAAHGRYGGYEASQVVLMLQGVRDFIARHPV
jgi:hypothetical protein